MKLPKDILERPHIKEYLEKRNLLAQYIAACRKLKTGFAKSLDFKERQPKQKGEWSFRINVQFRAFGFWENDDFYVTGISDHQNF